MTQKSRVLIVDDDPGVLRLAAKVLAQAGYDVHACANGDDAGRYLLEHTVDLLLTDKDLGRTSGIDIARGARELMPGLPVVLMTGAPDLHATSGFNFQGYLVKPFRNNRAIQDAVAAAIEAQQAVLAREAMTRKLQEVMTQLGPKKSL